VAEVRAGDVPASGTSVEQERVWTPCGKVRELTRLPDPLARAYAGSVAPWLARIERRLDPGVMANRSRRAGGLLPVEGERARFQRALRRGLGDGHAALGDVRDCYPSIGVDAVRRALAGAGADPAPSVSVLEALRRAGVRGLPIGPWPSAVLANLVLASADEAARAAGVRVVRWVDDVVLIAADRATACRALDAWVRALRALGLEAHEGKTSIVPAEEVRGTIVALGASVSGIETAVRGR